MIKTSDRYRQKIIEDGRLFNTKVHFNNDTVTLIDEIRTVVINEVCNNENTLKIGQVGMNKATVVFDTTNIKIPLANSSIRIESGLFIDDDYEYVNLGTYYVTEITKSDNSNIVTVVAYDSANRLNTVYKPTITYPNDIEAVVNDILKQCNINMEKFNFPTTMINGYIEGTTCKQMIGYMAGLVGKNIRINKDNKLEFYWYRKSDIEITYDLQFMNGFNRTTDEPLVLTSLTSGTKDNVLVAGSGYGISFENPYMTQEILDCIYLEVFPKDGIIYQPSTVKWRGNPTIEGVDIVKIQNRKGMFDTIFLTENTINVTGLNCEINCKGETEETVVMSKAPTDLKLDKMYTSLTNAFKESTETILGHNGGYFTIDMNSDGFPSGWTIMDTPTLREDTKLWKMTAGGFGFSHDGGKTFSNLTIDMLGRISANSITTGILHGDNFSLDLLEGSVVMGERNDKGEFVKEWFKVDKTGLHMTALETIDQKVEQIGESIYKFETGSWNIFDNCNQAIKKSMEDKSVSVEDMTLGIDKNYIRGRDICISTFVEMTNAIINSGYIGAEFTVGYADGSKKTYSTKIYPGDNLLQYTLSQGLTNISKRIYTHYKLEDKEITSVSNLKIIITCKGELLRISNPKVEFGIYPTGFDFDMQYVRDNITTLNKDYTEIVQTVNTISLQAVSLTEEVTTIKGDISTVQTRLQSAELKLTPTSITAMVNEKIGVDGKLESTKFVLDKLGVHISGGGLDILNNAGTKVLYADTNGNLIINNLTAVNGTFTGVVYATSGAFSGTINANNGSIGGWNVNENGFTNGVAKIDKTGVTNIYTWADLYVIRLIITGIVIADDDMVSHYDFNGDGKITASDYMTLKNRLKAL